MLLSGYLLLSLYEKIDDESSSSNTMRKIYIAFAAVIAALEVFLIFYLLRVVLRSGKTGMQRNIHIVLVFLVPELYGIFYVFFNKEAILKVIKENEDQAGGRSTPSLSFSDLRRMSPEPPESKATE